MLTHARALLTSSTPGAIDYIDADLRDPQTILRHAARTLDFSRPVAVMLVAIMHLIVDEDAPYGLVGQLLDAVPGGSYLALSQVASDIQAEQMAEAAKRYNRLARETQRHRDRAEVARFFDGLDLVEPGWCRSSSGDPRPTSRPGPGPPCGAAWPGNHNAPGPAFTGGHAGRRSPLWLVPLSPRRVPGAAYSAGAVARGGAGCRR